MFKGLSLFSRWGIKAKEENLTGIQNSESWNPKLNLGIKAKEENLTGIQNSESWNPKLNLGIKAKEENLTAIQNSDDDDDDDDDDDACIRKTIMTCDNGGGGWSDLTHDVLFLVMMQLGVIDFVAFSGVCKSWRSFALCNMNTFMVSRPPMFIEPPLGSDVEWCCYLRDIEGRNFKTVVPHSVGKICLGVTCGYVIMFGLETHDFWLVNLITRHELHFPNPPVSVKLNATLHRVRTILVFSPSIPGRWVFLVLNVNTHEIWFCRVGGKGKLGVWDHVYSTVPMQDLQFFKGKIYTLHGSSDLTYHGIMDDTCKMESIGIMRLNRKESKITILETKNFPSCTHKGMGIVCSGEDLYLVQGMRSELYLEFRFKLDKLDFDEMKWTVVDENAYKKVFLSYDSHGVVVNPESWWQAQFRTSTSDDLCGNEQFFDSNYAWYFVHECRNINHMDE